MIFSTIINDEKVDLNISSNNNEISLVNNKKQKTIDCIQISDDTFSLLLNGHVYYLTIIVELNSYEVLVNHSFSVVEVKDEIEVLKEDFGFNDSENKHSGDVYAQIPGLVTRVDVELGDNIKVGDTLCILEAMKMENEIKSPKSGSVRSIVVQSGSNVEKGDLLMEIID